MAGDTTLTAGQLDRIAQTLRLALGLFLLSAAYFSHAAAVGPPLEPAALWAMLGFSGGTAGFLTAFLFEGAWRDQLSPNGVLAAVYGVTLVGGFGLLTGLLTRFLAGVFATVLALAWLAPVLEHVFRAGWFDAGASAAVVVAGVPHLAVAAVFLALFQTGAGAGSVDARFNLSGARPGADWDLAGLTIRFALALLLLAAAAMAFFFARKVFDGPEWIPALLGALALTGLVPRATGIAIALFLGWQLGPGLAAATDFSTGLGFSYTALPFLGAALVLAMAGGGGRFRPRLTERSWGRRS
jgi:hypothetical protein